MFLFHATYKANIDSIIEKGLGAEQRKNWDFSEDGVVYFSDDENIANSYCETATDVLDEVYNSGIIVLACDADVLDDGLLFEDERIEGTFMYFDIVPSENLLVVSQNTITGNNEIVGKLIELREIPDFE